MAYANIINTTIVNSIPIDKDLKRYIVKWYRTMSVSNGLRFANATIKALRETLMGYRADVNRASNRNLWLSRMPIRKNWRLAQLLRYVDTMPHAVFNLLKLYTSEGSTVATPEESAHEFHELLLTIKGERKVPDFLVLWLRMLKSRRKDLILHYELAGDYVSSPYHYVVKHHTLEQWLSYWSAWKYRLLKLPQLEQSKSYKLSEIALDYIPSGEMYSDFDGNTSLAFESDVVQFLTYPCEDEDKEVNHLTSDIFDWLDTVSDDRLVSWDSYFDDFQQSDLTVVGRIHHIPKKGTDRRRPIAVPNRFLQLGLVPFQRYLYKILRALPRDHTFDQSKSRDYIQHRLDKGRYVASVDLSHATDYLPKQVFDYIADELLQGDNIDISMSRRLFDFMSRGKWQNGDNLSQWEVGQPLGTLPSFGALALEHNLLLESLALSCGYLHSPYTVLGDDVLLFSKRMRRAYLKVMDDLQVPLSLHKSYEHNLVEFAGQMLIAGQVPGYTPDHAKISWYNLFDWSRNSGVLLSFRELPAAIRSKLVKKARAVSLKGDTFYRLSAELYFAVYGSRYQGYMESTMALLPAYAALESERIIPDRERTSGFSVIFGGDVLIATPNAVRRQQTTKQWLVSKFKPSTTNAIVRNTIQIGRAHV